MMIDSSKNYNNESSLLVAAILDIGEMLLMSGAEVSRVEDTMERIGKAYHFTKVDIFSITSSLVFTVQTGDGEIITQTRRIRSTKVNMELLENINALSRELCNQIVPLETLQVSVNKLRESVQYGKFIKLLAYPIISATFTMFYGGSIIDAIASMLTGMFLYLVITIGYKIKIQSIVLYMFSSFITGMLVYTLITLGVGTSFDKIIIGNIMLLIPGISLTTSLRDMIKGDLISGLLGLSEALLKAFAIALGFSIVMIMKGVS